MNTISINGTTSEFNPDWASMAVMVEEQQRMAAEIETLKRLLDTAFSPQPVAWMMTNALGESYFRKKPQDKVFNPQPVYTRSQSPWIAFTEQEVDQFHNWKDCTWSTNELVRHVAAALKEKNT